LGLIVRGTQRVSAIPATQIDSYPSSPCPANRPYRPAMRRRTFEPRRHDSLPAMLVGMTVQRTQSGSTGGSTLPRVRRFGTVLIASVAVLVASLGNITTTQAAGKTYRVPASINRTGARDVSAKLNRFIRRVPNGSTIRFRPGTYRIDSAIQVDGRRNLVFDGDGATLRGNGCGPTDSMFLLGWGRASSGITIRDFTLRGTNPDGGTSAAYHAGCQNQMGVAIYQSSNVVISDVAISRVYGECVYVDYGHGNHTWSRDITFRDSTCDRTGRSGVAIVAGTAVTVANVSFDTIGMYPLNIEPNTSDGGGTYVTFRDNRVGSYGHARQFGVHLVCTNGGAAGAPIHHITITRNRVTGGTLSTYMWEPRNRDIVFTDNVSTVAADGPVVVIQHADRVTVTGNTQPMRSGRFGHFAGSTQVVYKRNRT